MTISEALRKYADIEADLLLGHVLKQAKEFLFVNPEKKLTEIQRKKFILLANYRRHGVPIAYLIGSKYFYGRNFKINKSVLIPRPESEWLIDRAKDILKGRQIKNIADIGTGSGCLAITLAKETSNKPTIIAIDISAEALKVAKRNATNLKAKVKFKKQDLLSGDRNSYDLVIANLPYVPIKQYEKLVAGLKHEPKNALIDKLGDFKLYEKLLAQLGAKSGKPTILLLEIDPTMKPKIERWLKEHRPETRPKFEKDIHGLWRYAEIRFGN